MGFDIQSLFGDVADLTADERQRHFDKLGVPPDIRDEVASLCRFDAGNVSLTDCVAEIASDVLRRDFSLAAGDVCGPYKLVRLLGEGGMGTVYLAERADGEVDHRVAIKFVRGASDYIGYRDRFLKERQILASLTHPNIARMLDAGHLASGQPYLVMEYVDGEPIDQFAAGFPVRRKIDLFLKVCSAVAGLHRNLIVHRDLKPANILVTAEGEPKLLDFGIAKILDLATDFTLTNVRMLTPDYASPEQVTGGRITTAVDIYSLGVILYQLLTGKPAHEFEDRSAEAVARTITSREVARPSSWAAELKGDLEYILLKALRKDPQERYATVERFADDLRAFLESRPIRARSADRWYRTRKFLRRYWVPMSAAAAVILSLSLALYVVNRERAVAQARVAQLHRLSGQLLEIEHQLASPGAGSDLKLHHDLAATSIQYLESLGREDLRSKQLTLEICTAYLRFARIQGVPEWNQQGRYSDADRTLSKVAELANSVLTADPANREALWLSANASHDRAVIAYIERRPDQVSAYSPKAVEGFDRLARLGNLTRHEINGATYIYGDLAEVHIGLHRFEEARRYAQLAIDFSRTTSTVPGPRGQAFNMLAGALTYLGDLPDAVKAMTAAHNLWDQLRRDEGDNRYSRLILCQTRCREGLLLGEDGGVNLNRPRESTVPLEEAFTAMEDYTQKDRNDYESRTAIATAGRYLGDILRRGDPKRALAVYDHSLLRIREVPNDVAARRLEVLLLAGSSHAARAMHREKDAKERLDAAFRLLSASGDYPAATILPGSEAALAMEALADHYADIGQPIPAIELYDRLSKAFDACNSCAERDLLAAVNLSRVQESFARTLRRAGNGEKAATVETGRAKLWELWNRKLPGNPFVLRQRG